jgi:hypothetical protein
MGISDREPIRFGLLFKRIIKRHRIGVGLADFAIMWIAQTKFGNEQSLASCREWAMAGWALITRLASAFREFVAPRYRPELHYMRGPGPACARRASAGRSLAVRPITSPQRARKPSRLK